MSMNEHFDKGQTWENEIIANAISSKKRAWIVAIISLLIALISIIIVLLLFPTKKEVPYVVTVDRSTGYTEVTKKLETSGISEDEAVTQANLVKYVSAREQYIPAILKQNYDLVSLMSGKQALKEYRSLWDAQNPENPSVKHGPKTFIDIRIKSIQFITEKIATVRFQREKRSHEQLVISDWVATIEFQYSQKPMKTKDRFSNPLGFQVINYRVNPEVLETIR